MVNEPSIPEPRPPPSHPVDPARLNRAFGPIMAGLIIDGVDLATFGPMGFFLGPVLGSAAGYWMGQALGLEKRSRWLCALAAGVYCTIPFTEMLPLATLVGAFVRYQEYDQARPRK